MVVVFGLILAAQYHVFMQVCGGIFILAFFWFILWGVNYLDDFTDWIRDQLL